MVVIMDFSGVIFYYPENELTKYLLDLRLYRPKCVQHFFSDLQSSMKAVHPKGLMGKLLELELKFLFQIEIQKKLLSQQQVLYNPRTGLK